MQTSKQHYLSNSRRAVEDNVAAVTVQSKQQKAVIFLSYIQSQHHILPFN